MFILQTDLYNDEEIDIELKQLEKKKILTIKGTQIIGPLSRHIT